ncbi:hypothetical protein [Oceanobacillus luteolus]|uniref:Uncharacterized protein n=1 Tax=Oceanobacillus luteolus TaxID=1274358 RepID=A0ABW4HU08_9BACI
MAEYKGVQLKAIKEWGEHDLAGFTANIYLNNMKIGAVVDKGFGGPLHVYLEKQKDTFLKIASTYKDEDGIYANDEALLHRLRVLSGIEKDFKKANKKGYSFITTVDYFPRDENGKITYGKPIREPAEETYFFNNDQQLQQMLNVKKPSKYEVFRTLDDFVIN